MVNGNPLLLIASASAYEAQTLERSLENAGWNLLRVESVDQVALLLDRSGTHIAVLVIDAGLLEMPHGAQWRGLRTLHPELGTIVRCLRPRRVLREQRDSRALEVHPDDVEGICDAVRRLCPPIRPTVLAPPLEETLS